MDVTVPTVSGEDGETDRFVLWAGALLHAPHRAVRQQAKTLHSLVYISGYFPSCSTLTTSSKSRLTRLPIRINEHNVHYPSQWHFHTRYTIT
jgi:hypothetical protein